MGDCGDGWWNLVNLIAALAALAAVWFAYRASKEPAICDARIASPFWPM